MNKARQLLVQAAEKMEIPSDVTAGIPRVEILGSRACSVEPQRGLLEYSCEKISIQTIDGIVLVLGERLQVRKMNTDKIYIEGKITSVDLTGVNCE